MGYEYIGNTHKTPYQCGTGLQFIHDERKFIAFYPVAIILHLHHQRTIGCSSDTYTFVELNRFAVALSYSS